MNRRRLAWVLLLVVGLVLLGPEVAEAQSGLDIPSVDLSIEQSEDAGDFSLTLQLLFLVTLLSLGPSIILMLTCFTRVYIVLSFVGRALSLQDMPPQQVLVGLALFLTIFIMAPTLGDIHDQALSPYLDGEIDEVETLERAAGPLRVFMFQHTSNDDLAFFMSSANLSKPETRADVPFWVLVPAFMLSEVKQAFLMGMLIFIPFVVVDMVVASVLMSMGMMMLPPVMISLPFKILLFVLVDGWTLIAQSVVETYGVG